MQRLAQQQDQPAASGVAAAGAAMERCAAALWEGVVQLVSYWRGIYFSNNHSLTLLL